MNMQANKLTRRINPVSGFMATLGVAALVGMWNVPVSFAQEHPTVNSITTPSTSAQKSDVTLQDVAAYVKSYVEDKSTNGLFSFTDKATHQRLALKLLDIHHDRLAQVGPDMFFVCSDFKTADGKHTYDLDFFVQGKSKDSLSVVADKTSIHKKDGKARYDWAFNAEKGGWVEKPVAAQANEHPTQ
jgi:hypothetical protein